MFTTYIINYIDIHTSKVKLTYQLNHIYTSTYYPLSAYANIHEIHKVKVIILTHIDLSQPSPFSSPPALHLPEQPVYVYYKHTAADAVTAAGGVGGMVDGYCMVEYMLRGYADDTCS